MAGGLPRLRYGERPGPGRGLRDPFTTAQPPTCGSPATWSTIATTILLATPLLWVLAGIFIGLTPRHLTGARRTAVRTIPALPLAVIALQAAVYVARQLSIS